MKRFRFSLESVLTVRRAAEETAQRALVEARRAVAAQTLAVETLLAVESAAKSDLAAASRPGELRMQDLLDRQRYLFSMTRFVLAARKRLADLETQAESARDRLVAAARDLKALETLRDRRHADWRREAERADQKEIDEAASAARRHSLAEPLK